jgi:hypothetical protein
MSFIATYDRPEADDYEQHVVRMASRWLRMISSPFTTKKMVDTFLAEIEAPHPQNYGCGWDELHKRFLEWSKQSGWADGTRIARSCGYEKL